MSTTLIAPNDAPPTLEEFLKRIKDVSTLPQVAMKVVEVANNENSGAADLKAAMESDAALSARVLRCVNSAAFSLRTRVTNLQTAIAYLGCKQIRNLAMTASVADLFKVDQPIGPYRRRELWRHFVAVAICARLIAMRKRLVNFEDAFLAGLLHDLGIILLDQHAHAAFERVMHSLDPQKTLADVEREQMGYDHTVVGEGLAAQWKMPDVVRGAMRHHHNSSLYKGPEHDIIRCVEIANMICTLKGLPSIGVNLLKPSNDAIRALQFTRDDVLVLSEDLDREIQSHSDLFLM
jgi:HD-like signal output (HDOD) protein